MTVTRSVAPSTEPAERRVAFASHGARLAGVLWVPAGPAPAGGWPGVVLCQGYTAAKEVFLPALAHAFAAGGLAALVFDYRGWGESEGARGTLFPREQVEDVRSALGFLGGEPEVDARRLGLYGTSFGAANAIAAAAGDPRARAVVASLAIGSGRRWLRSLRRLWEWQELLARIDEDRVRRATTGVSAKIPAFELVPPDPAMREMMEQAAAAGWFSGADATVTLESAEAILEFAPEDVVGRIAPRPLLLVHGDRDSLVSIEEPEALLARAGERKRLYVVRGAGHTDFYLGDALEEVTAVSLAWLSESL